VRGGGYPGWIAQQVLKLKIASQISSDYYTVLDAKNILTKDIKKDTLVTPCNQAVDRALFTAWDMPSPHKEWYYRTAGHLGIPWPAQGLWPDSVTPFTFHTKTVLNMLAAIGEDPNVWGLCRGPLCGWFHEQSATEFILYELYANYRTNVQCHRAKEQVPLVCSTWRGQDARGCVDAATANNDQFFFFGVQAGGFDGLWGEQRNDVGRRVFQLMNFSGLAPNAPPDGGPPDWWLNCLR
jgi:hypothetical protein